jgi:hypothetical protein
MRFVVTGIVVLMFGGIAVSYWSDARPQSVVASLVVVGVGLVLVVAMWLFARDKFDRAERRHKKKLAKGHTLVSAEVKSCYGGSDIVLTYSDGKRIVIDDEDEIPAWAVVSEKAKLPE